MKFHVTEIKALGSGMSRRLSLRLEKSDDSNSAQSNAAGDPPQAVFTVHAVVPYNPEFGPTQIGQVFEFAAPEQDSAPFFTVKKK